MLNKEQLQRFSIRKLTVGTASVLIGVSILTSWNTNKVYADSGNVTSGESIAKNNNPQETGIWGGARPISRFSR
ncbi:YSIRK-type signal peptide-containing protein [Lactobacillus crispatus]|uniref:YSIRK-type signal peptide-containing protein n=1 Tax=Lactobacillus crispatus TaxID=47770 RepID=UPI0018E368E9|nr:YSIRK-type signal peptide-containing protein [Lactobacillus crispatus]